MRTHLLKHHLNISIYQCQVRIVNIIFVIINTIMLKNLGPNPIFYFSKVLNPDEKPNGSETLICILYLYCIYILQECSEEFRLEADISRHLKEVHSLRFEGLERLEDIETSETEVHVEDIRDVRVNLGNTKIHISYIWAVRDLYSRIFTASYRLRYFELQVMI